MSYYLFSVNGKGISYKDSLFRILDEIKGFYD